MASSVNQPRKTFEPSVASLREKKPLACGGNGRCQRALIVTASCSEQRHRALEARGNILGNRHSGGFAREVGLDEQAIFGNCARIGTSSLRFEHALVHGEEASRIDSASQLLLRAREPVENTDASIEAPCAFEHIEWMDIMRRGNSASGRAAATQTRSNASICASRVSARRG